ncbi:MAG: hypothetical protein ABIJ00_11670 [Candidatus Eisenbacteria bacterium]
MKRMCCFLVVVLTGLSINCSEKHQSPTAPRFDPGPSANPTTAPSDTLGMDHDSRARIWQEDSYPPTLTGGDVSPASGTIAVEFEYTVDYYDLDGDEPSVIQVHVDGNPNDMTLTSGRPDSGSYYFATSLERGDAHSYFFYCRDDADDPGRLPGVGSYAGPDVHGTNPSVRVAVHVLPHRPRTCSKNFPAIDGWGDIITTEQRADADCFPVFYYLEEYQGFDYALTWPGLYSCVFTSCSDITVGAIVMPGDAISHTWNTCQTSSAAIPGWAWIFDYGVVSVIPHPDLGTIDVRDCEHPVGIDHPDYSVFAGIGGAIGQDPWW